MPLTWNGSHAEEEKSHEKRQEQVKNVLRYRKCLKGRKRMSTSENSNADRGKNASSNSSPKVLLDGLAYVESPRWHEGRLWFCNWINQQVVAVGLDGKPEVMAPGPGPSRPMGWSIDWQPDGRLLVTGDKLRRQEPGLRVPRRRVCASARKSPRG